MSEGVEPFGTAELDALSMRAAASPRLRQHRNIHQSHDDPCQRLLNAIEPGSYLRPYRYLAHPRNKLLVALRGAFVVVLFDTDGAITRTVRFGAGADTHCMVEVAGTVWNSVVSLQRGSVLLEAKAGPYDADEPREFPAWAPAEGTPEAAAYARALRQSADHWLAGHRIDLPRGRA